MHFKIPPWSKYWIEEDIYFRSLFTVNDSTSIFRKSSYKSETPLIQIHQYFKIRPPDLNDSGLANTSITALSDECCLVVIVLIENQIAILASQLEMLSQKL